MREIHPGTMDGESLDVAEKLIEDLRTLVPAAVSEGRVDCGKLQELLGQRAIQDGSETYELTWAGRRRAFELIKEPTAKTLRTDPGGSVNYDEAENLFIEGDNLTALKILQQSYYERVKMIYLDPPYNTGKDFVYRDDFHETTSDYEERTGQRDAEGRLVSNPETSGRYHSDWLTMMYPRLFLARNLLRRDGVLFISIDDNEIHNLRIILDEIFGRENFIADIIWHSTKSVTNTALISESHTHNLVYAKDKEYFTHHRDEFRLPDSKDGFTNPDDDPRGPWKADPFQVGGWRPNQQYEIENPNTGEVYTPNEGNSWKNDYETFQELKADDRIVFGKTGEGAPKRKRFWSEAKERGRVSTTLWTDVDTTRNATMNFRELMGGDYFDNPKPVDLVMKMIQLGTTSDSDIIMDFFAGSGTTAHATLQFNEEEGTNHSFICVQLDEETPEDSAARDAGYETIAEIARERIRRVLDNPELPPDQETLGGDETAEGFKSLRVVESNFVQWRPPADEAELQKRLDEHTSSLGTDASPEDALLELLLKEGFTPNARIERIDHDGATFHRVRESGAETYITLDGPVTAEHVEDLGLTTETPLICLDATLTDTAKENLGRRCRLKAI